MKRMRFTFRGTVQGVGFRPAVYRAASSLSLSGFVQNRRSEVVAEVEGDESALAAFPDALRRFLPTAACLEGVESREIPTARGGPERGFRIADSADSEYRFPPIPPDLALCGDCARELLDPANRRYLYPFITCTQCGPRYSIVEATPFDRASTSMRAFTQCPECLREYGDPEDRRFHSQTNSCPACGPILSTCDAAGVVLSGDPLSHAIHALSRGGIVALQGIGGFHLAADPSSPRAMERLRHAKDRERKPFALMVRDIQEARRLCVLSGEEERILLGPESPILIAPQRPDSPAHLGAVSHTGTLGIMLPYSPLHLLLFRHPGHSVPYTHLVMTSGNKAGEPIAVTREEALARLSDTADLFLFHDRRIVFRGDDSIVRRGVSSPPFLLRRSRGFVPRLVSLRDPVQGTILAAGGDLKSSPALARGTDVHLAPYLGDLDDAENLAWYESQVRGLLGLYGARVETVVHDLHPLYRSTQWALGAGFARAVGVQHHHAHLLSVMAEHGLERAIGLAFDGTGYGTDGTIWGGEFMEADRRTFTRLGWFRPFPLPGGDAAVLHPPRTALAILAGGETGGRKDARAESIPEIPGLGPEREMILAMIKKGVNAPLTSSLGRIFDAAAAVLGLVETASYEGEGPIMLEGLALGRFIRGERILSDLEAERLLPFSGGFPFTVDPAPLILHLLTQRPHAAAAELALIFHEAAAWASREGARRMREKTGLDALVLSGGVFQNLLLRELLIPLLMEDGFGVYVNERVPPGDGGISLGQVYYLP